MKINTELIDNFIKTTDWEAVWNEDSFSQGNTEAVDKNIDYSVFDWACGATKMVIQPNNENFVIKLPFRFTYIEDYSDYYNDESEEDVHYYYQEMAAAPLPKEGMISPTEYYRHTWDYCQTELEYCELAAAADIGEFFPELSLYCETPYPIYIEEKCYPSYRHTPVKHTLTRNNLITLIQEQAQSNEIAKWVSNFDSTWLNIAIDYYGLNKVIKLFQFLNKYHMIDFHGENYGYRTTDNSPVLIDFAGYYEE